MRASTSRPEPELEAAPSCLGETSRAVSPSPVDATARRRNLGTLAIAGVALFYGLIVLYYIGPFGDTRSFWLPWSRPIYDPATPLWDAHFVYSPVAALVLRPFGILPFPIFAAMWTVLGIATYAWLLWPLPAVPRVVALAAGCTFALNGNVEWALAFMVVLGMSRPSAWLFAAFTKVSPFMGFGWFVWTRDWHAVATTAAVGALLIIVTAIAVPDLWATWLPMLLTFRDQTAHAGPLMPAVPLLPRIPIAAAVLLWGAATRRSVVLPVVVLLTQPDLQPWIFGYLAALPRLWLMLPRGQQPEASGAVAP